MTKIETISLDTSKKICVTNVLEDVICDACDPCNAMCFNYSRYSAFTALTASKKLQKSDTWKQDGSWSGDTEDLTIQGLKDREIDLISRKVWRKKKRFSKEEIDWYAMRK